MVSILKDHEIKNSTMKVLTKSKLTFYSFVFSVVLIFLVIPLILSFIFVLLYSAEKVKPLFSITILIFLLTQVFFILNFNRYYTYITLLLIITGSLVLKFSPSSISNYYSAQKYNALSTCYFLVSGTPSLKIFHASFPNSPEKGQLWSEDNSKIAYWYDGYSWRLMRDENRKYHGPISMKVRFNYRPDSSEPLLSTGTPGLGDTVYVKYLPDDTIQINGDHWGVHGADGKILKLNPDHTYKVDISFNSFYSNKISDKVNNNLLVWIDDELVVDSVLSAYPISFNQISAGVNRAHCNVCGEYFTGEIKEIKRIKPKH